MSKYIDLDKAITIFDTHGRKLTTTVFQILDRNGAIYETADVVEQKHGQWILTDYEDEQTYKCSECGELWTFIVGTPKDNGANYCPNCGARMVSDDV